MCAWRPCDRIPSYRNVGQWLCVPPFRVVCLFQVSGSVARRALLSTFPVSYMENQPSEIVFLPAFSAPQVAQPCRPADKGQKHTITKHQVRRTGRCGGV